MRTVLADGPYSPESAPRERATVYASIGAAAFAVHPVAVYGAGYLVQRTVVMATLFSLLSILLFARGLARKSHPDAISAALMYAFAVLCKEHSILLPAAAVLTVALVKAPRPFAFRHAAVYLALCAPPALYVVVFRSWLIGKGYEPDYAVVANQLESVFGHAMKDFSLPLSIVTQAGLFFNYLALWLWPDVRGMSLDLRVDFFQTWSAAWIVLKISSFLAFGALGGLLLRRGGRAGLIGFGMLYTWILFLVEFSTARFQEPMVLYRSYLWAPGIVIAVTALLSTIPLRATLAAAALALPVLFYQAHDRLTTFSRSLFLWEDAVAKLPDAAVPWGSRTLYMLGREYVYSGQPEKAIRVADRCMVQYPGTVHCYYARGVIHFLLGQYDQALPLLSRAVELQPESGIAHHRLGLDLEHLGRIQDALSEYQQAAKLGFQGAQWEIDRLKSHAKGAAQAKRGPSNTR
jgi:tetratricopeptide (TPR) repeat protein